MRYIMGYVNLRLGVHGVSALRHCSFACTAPLPVVHGEIASVWALRAEGGGVACGRTAAPPPRKGLLN